MNYAETAQLLTAVAACDNRRIDDATVAMWHDVLGDLPLADALEAIRRHFAKSTEWLMPAHIRAGVGLIREARRPRSEVLALPSRFEYDPERAAQVRAGIARCTAALDIARTRRPKPIEAVEKPPPSPADIIRERALRRARAERKSA